LIPHQLGHCDSQPTYGLESNAKWAVLPFFVTEENIWDTDWILQNTNPNCDVKLAEKMPEREWNNNSTKSRTCFDLLNMPEHTDACMKTVANTFSLCQIKEFKDFCFNANIYRRDIGSVE